MLQKNYIKAKLVYLQVLNRQNYIKKMKLSIIKMIDVDEIYIILDGIVESTTSNKIKENKPTKRKLFGLN